MPESNLKQIIDFSSPKAADDFRVVLGSKVGKFVDRFEREGSLVRFGFEPYTSSEIIGWSLREAAKLGIKFSGTEQRR